MTPKTSTGKSPYSLAFGTEAVLPPEVVFPTLRVQTHGEEASNQQLRENLDLLEEKRADAHLRTLAYSRAITKLYNRRVRPRLVMMGDLVLRKAEVSDPTRSHGKLAPNWEGPYRVIEVVREGTYALQQWRGECYRELDIFQIYENFTRNMKRCVPSCIDEKYDYQRCRKQNKAFSDPNYKMISSKLQSQGSGGSELSNVCYLSIGTRSSSGWMVKGSSSTSESGCRA
ncbi:hypothetical protein BHE74_00038391 [Ensete ventricosum]|nr:hypothetical protein BHE74_00038391 [Ensete ventricosum]